MDEETNREYYKRVRIVEEVPGVPDNEKWFICGGTFEYPYLQFAECADAETYLKQQGIVDYTIECFEP
jgi:hypothetical protein